MITKGGLQIIIFFSNFGWFAFKAILKKGGSYEISC